MVSCVELFTQTINKADAQFVNNFYAQFNVIIIFLNILFRDAKYILATKVKKCTTNLTDYISLGIICGHIVFLYINNTFGIKSNATLFVLDFFIIQLLFLCTIHWLQLRTFYIRYVKITM